MNIRFLKNLRGALVRAAILCAAGATLLSTASANTANEGQPVRQITFRTLQLAGGDPEPVFLSEKDTWKLCNLSKRRISPEVTATVVGEQMVFARPSQTLDANGSPLMQPVAEVRLPPTGKNFLLLFRQRADNPGQLEAFALGQEELRGQSGQTILYNASSYPIVGEIEKQRFQLERGGSTRIEATAGQNNNLSLRLARYAEDEWRIAFSTVWGHKKDLNTLFFISDAPAGKDTINVQRFYDVPIRQEEPQGSGISASVAPLRTR